MRKIIADNVASWLVQKEYMPSKEVFFEHKNTFWFDLWFGWAYMQMYGKELEQKKIEGLDFKRWEGLKWVGR